MAITAAISMPHLFSLFSIRTIYIKVWVTACLTSGILYSYCSLQGKIKVIKNAGNLLSSICPGNLLLGSARNCAFCFHSKHPTTTTNLFLKKKKKKSCLPLTCLRDGPFHFLRFYPLNPSSLLATPPPGSYVV